VPPTSPSPQRQYCARHLCILQAVSGV
jgi:hypothetical protein